MPLALSLVLSILTGQENPAPYNSAVRAYCQQNLNQKIGRGECSDLAAAALAAAGAASMSKNEIPAKGDYVWGQCVYILDCRRNSRTEIFPSTGYVPAAGDIVQLRDIKLGRTTVHPDGSTSWYSMEYGHHTSVISSISADGSTWKVFEQNVNGKKQVMENPMVLPDVQQGYLRVYRPVKAP